MCRRGGGSRGSAKGVSVANTLRVLAVQGMAEGEGVRTRIKGGLHGTEEVPGVLVGSMLRIFIDAKDVPIDLEDDVLMVLSLVAGGVPWTALIWMAFHHPA